MADYLLQITYTKAAFTVFMTNPQDRTEMVNQAIESLGGKMHGFWFAFGENDVIGIIEMPNNIAAAAFSIALSAGGAVASIKTTPLLKIADGMKAMKKAAACDYHPAVKAG